MVRTCRTPGEPGLHSSVQRQTVFKDLPCSWKVVSTCKAGGACQAANSCIANEFIPCWSMTDTHSV